MQFDDLVRRFQDTPENRQRAIFSTLFIAANKLQALFDSRIPEVTLRQFMLLSVARQAPEAQTLTQLGALLGCSRQNVKKLAEALEKKGFAELRQSPEDARALCLCLTEKADAFFAGDFAPYRDDLRHLFAVYTQEETQTLFRLLTRLCAGIENLEEKGVRS